MKIHNIGHWTRTRRSCHSGVKTKWLKGELSPKRLIEKMYDLSETFENGVFEYRYFVQFRLVIKTDKNGMIVWMKSTQEILIENI